MRERLEQTRLQLRRNPRPIVFYPKNGIVLFLRDDDPHRGADGTDTQSVGHQIRQHPRKPLSINSHGDIGFGHTQKQALAGLAGHQLEGDQPLAHALDKIHRIGDKLERRRAHAGDFHKLPGHGPQPGGILPHRLNEHGHLLIQPRTPGHEIRRQTKGLHGRLQFVGYPVHHFRTQPVAPPLLGHVAQEKHLPRHRAFAAEQAPPTPGINALLTADAQGDLLLALHVVAESVPQGHVVGRAGGQIPPRLALHIIFGQAKKRKHTVADQHDVPCGAQHQDPVLDRLEDHFKLPLFHDQLVHIQLVQFPEAIPQAGQLIEQQPHFQRLRVRQMELPPKLRAIAEQFRHPPQRMGQTLRHAVRKEKGPKRAEQERRGRHRHHDVAEPGVLAEPQEHAPLVDLNQGVDAGVQAPVIGVVRSLAVCIP